MRQILATAALLATGFALTPAVASAAPASVGTCNGTTKVELGNGTSIRQPYHTGTGSRNCELFRGTSGSAVKTLQQALKHCNFEANIALDGDFGTMTEKALTYAQSRLHVDDDGIYGPNTRLVLGWPAYHENGKPNGKCAKGH